MATWFTHLITDAAFQKYWGCGFVNIVFCRYPVYNGSRKQEQEETWR